ncbi:MAG: redoxin domain-containing protein [Vampirovibrionales bacterium]|nr:redoxin domain-containing protein [Vampirovibrionales bacterium]
MISPFAKPLPLEAQAPAFARIDQHSRTVYSERLLASGGYIAHFYGLPAHKTTRQNLHFLKTVTPMLESKGLSVIGFNPADWETQYRLAQELQLPYSLLYDPLSQTASAFGATFVKTFLNHCVTFGVNSTGKIIFVHKGALPDEALFLETLRRF